MRPAQITLRSQRCLLAAFSADCAIRTRFARRVVDIVAGHAFHVDPWLGPDDDGLATRRFLAAHGAGLARDLVCHKRCDLEAKAVGPDELVALERLARELETHAGDPHRIADLAVSGDDLIAAGVAAGPAVGDALRRLLARVVDDPGLNRRDTLLGLLDEVRA